MLRLLLILSFVLQPMALLRMDCAGSHIASSVLAVGGCCGSAGRCSLGLDDVRENGCCSGAVVCNCGEKRRERPAPPPSRSSATDQVLALLQLPGPNLPLVDELGAAPRKAAPLDVMLPAMERPQAFFCVWLT